MRKVYILKGLPASGKSTWAKKLIDENPNVYKRINKDDLRAMLDNSHWGRDNEKFVLQIRDTIMIQALTRGKSVIIDDTNLHKKHETRIKQVIDNWKTLSPVHQDIKIIVKEFHIDLEEAIKRDLNRPNSVGERVIKEMYNTYLRPDVVKLEQNSELPHVIICDLDGTVALMNNRGTFDYQKCDTDLPNEPVIKIVENYLSYGEGNIIFVSGREDTCKEKTMNWLKRHIQLMDSEVTIHMRRKGDFRKDSIVKKEIFDNYIKDKFYIDFILDDRLQVCRMWYELGLTLLKVGDPDANF